MPLFIYLARSGSGARIEGRLIAENRQAALQELDRQGYFPISISTEEAGGKKPYRFVIRRKRIRNRDLATFYLQFAELLGGGLTVASSLDLLIEQYRGSPLRDTLENIVLHLRKGVSLSQCMNFHLETFSRLAINLVNAGERSGSLEEVLTRLSIVVEREDELRSKIRSSLAYPVLLMFVSFITILALTWFVIPNLAGLLGEMGQRLPWPTRVVIGISVFLRNYVWWLVAGVFGVMVLLSRKKPRTLLEAAYETVGLRLPIIGNIIVKVQLVSFSRTLSSLLKNGITILPAWDVACNAVGNQVIRSALQAQRGRLEKGYKIGESLATLEFIPPIMPLAISVGEEGDRLEPAMIRVADIFQREVDRRIKLLTGLLEPTMILAVGLLVGLLIISIMLPLLNLDLGDAR